MSTRRRSIRPEARAELADAVDWYEEQRVGLGGELLAEFEERVALAMNEVGTGAPIATLSDGTESRRYRLRRFGRYSIFLMISSDALTVLAFAHSSRRPGYWKSRVK